MSKWISVDEKLPDEGKMVVAARFYEPIEEPDAAVCWFLKGVFVASDEALDAENYDGGACIRLDMVPTHWMPLEMNL
nr:DUF551 domain-containing protein [uncultured Halomonas sp.]